MDKNYIDSIHPTILPELKSYVELCYEHLLAPHTLRDRMHALHVESLITLVKNRMEELTETAWA